MTLLELQQLAVRETIAFHKKSFKTAAAQESERRRVAKIIELAIAQGRKPVIKVKAETRRHGSP